MFDRITLHNFQCHESLTIKLDKITTLVGPSDSGKTAILRAIDWLCFNKGRTALLLRRGSDVVDVELDVDGHHIIRSTKDNSYTVDSMVYNAIGRNIPDEVTSILRMSDDNIQRQHNYLFWFTESGSGLISCLNRIVDLTKLDEWVKTGATKERSLKDDEKVYADRYKDLVTERDSLVPFETIDSELAVLESSEESITCDNTRLSDIRDTVIDYDCADTNVLLLNSMSSEWTSVINYSESLLDDRNRMAGIETAVTNIDFCENKIATLRSILDFEYPVDDLILDSRRLFDLQSLLSEYDILNGVNYQYYYDMMADLSSYCDLPQCEQRLNQLTSVLKSIEQLDGVDFSGLFQDISDLFEMLDDITVMSGKLNGLLAVSSDWKTILRNIEGLKLQYNDVDAEFKQKLEGRCPICGGEYGGEL